MAHPSSRFHNAGNIIKFLDKLNAEQERAGRLPFHYETEGERLMLYGTNNLGEADAHGLLRLEHDTLYYEGEVHVAAHLDGLSIHTCGEGSAIRVTGYACGISEEKPARLVSEDGGVFLGDPGHPERKLVAYVHIESAKGVTVYKRQLLHVTLVNREGDAVIRGQNIQNTSIETPSLNLNASSCREVSIRTRGDAMMKCSQIADSAIHASDGDVYLCAGSVRNCKIEAKYDIEMNGSVDVFTLEHARSLKGVVRHDGVELSGRRGGTPSAPARRSAAAAGGAKRRRAAAG